MVKHILFSGNNAWGMYNFREKVLSHYVKVGYRVSVSAPYDEEYFKKLEELGCEVYDVSLNPKGTNPFKDFDLIMQYRRLLKKIKPDVSITYTIKPNIYCSIAAQMESIPYLPITTGLGYVFIQKTLVSKIAKFLYRVAFRKAFKVWFLNTDDVASFRRAHLVKESLIEQLPSEGIDLEKFSYIPCQSTTSKPFTFLLVGRMLKDKGVLEYVEAAKVLRTKYPQVRFQLLGNVWEDNPAAIPLEHLKQWSEEGIVEYLGGVEDVRPLLVQSDCVVLPSYREGVPCTLMEAAAIGRPLIATDVPGCRDVVKDDENGFLCKVKDASDLADKMERMLNLSNEERIQMGKNGRKMMEEKFDIDIIIQQYDRTLDNIFSNKL